MREREKEIGETAERDIRGEGEPLWETRVKGLSTTMERSLKGLSKISSNLSKSFLMVAKKLALQCKGPLPILRRQDARLWQQQSLCAHRSHTGLAGAQPGLPNIYDIYKCLLRAKIYLRMFYFAEIW